LTEATCFKEGLGEGIVYDHTLGRRRKACSTTEKKGKKTRKKRRSLVKLQELGKRNKFLQGISRGSRTIAGGKNPVRGGPVCEAGVTMKRKPSPRGDENG